MPDLNDDTEDDEEVIVTASDGEFVLETGATYKANARLHAAFKALARPDDVDLDLIDSGSKILDLMDALKNALTPEPKKPDA